MNVFDKAYERLTELYGGKDSTDIRILNRFYYEKKILLQCEFYMRYLELFARIRETAEKKAEHILTMGTTGASFVAYLLGATDINPLPRHEYCPVCHKVRFVDGERHPFECGHETCKCGATLISDGYDIPFDTNLKSVLSGHIQLGTSRVFFEEAKGMITEEMWDKSIVTLTSGEEISPTWFCFFGSDKDDSEEVILSDNRKLFEPFPRITLVPIDRLDRFRELEQTTGVKMRDVHRTNAMEVFLALIGGDVEGVPHMEQKAMKDLITRIKPESYDDLLGLIGYAHGVGVWTDNGERWFDDRKMPLCEIPAYCEDIYNAVCEKLSKNGLYENGIAYEVMDRARRGSYARNKVDKDTADALHTLGFESDFVFFLEKIQSMFTKAQGVAYLREAIAMMWYKIHRKDEFEKIMSGERQF